MDHVPSPVPQLAPPVSVNSIFDGLEEEEQNMRSFEQQFAETIMGNTPTGNSSQQPRQRQLTPQQPYADSRTQRITRRPLSESNTRAGSDVETGQDQQFSHAMNYASTQIIPSAHVVNVYNAVGE
jgi:hypothetical protein